MAVEDRRHEGRSVHGTLHEVPRHEEATVAHEGHEVDLGPGQLVVWGG